jgi:hypothetical protein
MSLRPRAAASVLVPAVLLIWLLATATPAAASCALPPKESSHRFTGLVLATDDDGRTATVRTQDGRVVTVIGAEGGPGAVTSVDRTYRASVRYDFHPLNDVSPYRDNACTATRELGPTGVAHRDTGGAFPGWLPDGPVGWLGLGAVLVALFALGAAVLRHGVRRRALG